MKDGKAAVDLSAKLFSSPSQARSNSMNSPEGMLDSVRVALSSFSGKAFGGFSTAPAACRWGANWTLEGEISARAVDPGKFGATSFPPAASKAGRLSRCARSCAQPAADDAARWQLRSA